ncbi:MAG: 30S ribosomal protein S6 [Acidimicrobiales bacterium]|nr:30S ribosomal protein S6 [Acidimicrobiales bacterium]
MRAYELMVIIDGELEEPAAQSRASDIETRLNERGTVGSKDFWGRRQFAYEIDHKSEGTYVVFEILADPGALDPIERSLRLADDIVRHKLLRLPDHEAARRGLIGSAAD